MKTFKDLGKIYCGDYIGDYFLINAALSNYRQLGSEITIHQCDGQLIAKYKLLVSKNDNPFIIPFEMIKKGAKRKVAKLNNELQGDVH